jgi:hypothetical protein
VVLVLAVTANAYQPLKDLTVQCAKESSRHVDIGDWLSDSVEKPFLVVFGTHAADFNTIEYGQRLRYYWLKLEQEKRLNCRPAAAKFLAEQVDLPDDIALWVDNTGQAGQKFGVCRGWLPENKKVNPDVKLFATLP